MSSVARYGTSNHTRTKAVGRGRCRRPVTAPAAAAARIGIVTYPDRDRAVRRPVGAQSSAMARGARRRSSGRSCAWEAAGPQVLVPVRAEAHDRIEAVCDGQGDRDAPGPGDQPPAPRHGRPVEEEQARGKQTCRGVRRSLREQPGSEHEAERERVSGRHPPAESHREPGRRRHERGGERVEDPRASRGRRGMARWRRGPPQPARPACRRARGRSRPHITTVARGPATAEIRRSAVKGATPRPHQDRPEPREQRLDSDCSEEKWSAGSPRPSSAHCAYSDSS